LGLAVGEPRGPWLRWALFWSAWTAFGLMLAAPRVLLQTGGAAVGWPEALRIALLDMYSWGLVALAALALARRVPLCRGVGPRAVALLAGGGLLILLARFGAANLLALALGWVPRLPPPSLFLQVLPWNLLFLAGLLGLGYGVDHSRRYRERELDTARLERQAAVLQARLARARLDTLKTELHPHFLFNTLNAIAALVHRDPERAETMITHLGDLLRTALEQRGRDEVTLREEIRVLEPYLAIERARFGDRLAVEVAVEPEALDARLPHLILQPLVENAIRHGLVPRQGRGRVEIGARREDGSLRVWVRDDGDGFREPPRARRRRPGGVGLSNSRARLEHLYGARGRLRTGNHDGGGAEVEISIPFVQDPAPQAPGPRPGSHRVPLQYPGPRAGLPR
jgi:two-component system, LytTR family, sensor kinase